MRLLDLTLPTLEENLALDEALLLAAESGHGQEVLRFWHWRQIGVVLGAGCRLADDVIESRCLTDGIPICRRASGGGTVLLGGGCLLFSLVLKYQRSEALQEIASSYHLILKQIHHALAAHIPGIELAGISDLTLAGRKFSGNAQQRKRHVLLHHGTLLYDFNLESAARYLHMPARQPVYRRQRTHREFMTNLPLDEAQLKCLITAAWQAEPMTVEMPLQAVSSLVAEKYGKSDWTRRR